MKKAFSYFFFGLLILAGLYVSSLYNYLLFHNLAEIFSIVIAFGIFTIAWNSRPFLDNNYLLFIGIAYLFVGGLDLLHPEGKFNYVSPSCKRITGRDAEEFIWDPSLKESLKWNEVEVLIESIE